MQLPGKSRLDRSLLVTIAIALLSLLLSGFAAYSVDIDTTHSRLAVVETEQQNSASRQEDIKREVRAANEKLDRLLFYLLPKHR